MKTDTLSTGWKGAGLMKLSIIVPCYNSGEYVETALNSIPKREDIEIIIINDGSTDNTKEICEKWKKGKKNVKLINLPENKGLGHAKNVGYDNAKGEYINQLDSDDYLYPDEYEKVIDQLDGTDIVYMNLKQNNGTILDIEQSPEYFCSGCARFIRREFLGKTRCPETRYAEDWHLTQELNKKKHTDKFTGIVGYHYNFPREGSLVDQAVKGLIQDTAGKQKKIILWQSYLCPIGGVETFIYNWSIQLREYYDILILCQAGDGKQLARLREYVDCEVIDKEKTYYADILIRNSVWGKLPQNIKAPRIIEMKHANYKFLYETSQFKDQYIKDPRIHEHLACGEFVAKMYEEVEHIKIPFIRNILAPKKDTEKIYRFITCSRIEDPQKGWKRMQQMCEMLRKAHMKYEWIVFSKQPPDTQIPREVHFYEPQFDTFDYVSDADYSVLLSDSEGLPLQILESLQYQTPCIVTDVGGCTELIKDGVNGYVVPLDMNFDINRIKDIPKLKPYKGTTAKDWCDYLGGAVYMKKETKKKEPAQGLKVKIIPICDYYDTQENRNITAGKIYEVTEERANQIIKADLARLYEG